MTGDRAPRPGDPADQRATAEPTPAAGSEGGLRPLQPSAGPEAVSSDSATGRAAEAEAPAASASLARSSALMASGTMASRVLGLVKGMMLAAVVGGGLAGDAFDVANSLPNQFYNLIAGGILTAVLVPQITKAAKQDDDGGVDFTNRLLTLALLIMAGATLICTLAAPLLVRVFTQGWDDDALALTTTFALICLPQIFFYGLTALLGQVLNARGRFAAFGWTPVWANVVSIAGMLLGWSLLGWPRQGDVDDWTPSMIWLLAGTATLGIVIQGVFLFIPLRRAGYVYRPTFGFRGVGLGSASRVALWTFAAVAVSQLGFVLTSRVLTWAQHAMTQAGMEGAGKTSYTNAFLFFMLPHSLVTVSLVTALFTRLSNSVHDGRRDLVVADLGRGLRMPAVLLVPVSIGGVLLAQPVFQLLFERFAGWPHSRVVATAAVFIAMLLGLVPYGWLYLIQRIYYAFEDARTPFFLQVGVTVVATVVNLVAFTFPPENAGVVVGIGQTLSNLTAAVVGFVLLRRKLGPLRLLRSVQTYVRLILASLVAALPAWLMLEGARRLGGGTSVLLVTVAVTGVLFLGLFLLLAHRMRVREVRDLLAPLTRRLGLA